MKTFFIVIVLLIGGLILSKVVPNPPPIKIDTQIAKPSTDTSTVTTIAEGFDTPWAIAFVPASPAGGPNNLLVTERSGRVRVITDNKLQAEPVANLTKVKEIGEGGLLGIATHPHFSSNHFVYLYYTNSEGGDNTLNRVVRMTYDNSQLIKEQIIVDNIPVASNHNGGRIKFGPDGYLYITTGDAENPSQAQNTNVLGGKILRVTDEGQMAPGNPFDNLVYSYGHRNPQGIAWDADGRLWETEHGPSGNDEINLIEIGRNYGWPEIQGSQTKSGMETPIRYSGSTTWAPAGSTFVNNSLFFGGLRGQTLYEAVIQDGQVIEFREHFKREFGRIREVILGPDNMLYITTSNKDGRGSPAESDDRVIKINPQGL